MTRKTKRLIRVRVVTALAYITCAIMVLAVAGLAYLALDFLGFMAWAMSGQTPTGFYLGKLTVEIILLIN